MAFFFLGHYEGQVFMNQKQFENQNKKILFGIHKSEDVGCLDNFLIKSVLTGRSRLEVSVRWGGCVT